MVDWVIGKVIKVQNWIDVLFSFIVYVFVFLFIVG